MLPTVDHFTMMRLVSISVILCCIVAPLHFTTSVTRLPSLPSTTSTPPWSSATEEPSKLPHEKCECVNKTQFRHDIKYINDSVRDKIEWTTFIKDTKIITIKLLKFSLKIDEICKCKVIEDIDELGKEINTRINSVSTNIKSSNLCKCVDRTEDDIHFTKIQVGVENIKNKTEQIKLKLIRRAYDRGLIDNKLNNMLDMSSDKKSCQCDNLNEKNEEIINDLENILDTLTNGSNISKCDCDAHLHKQTSTLQGRQDLILKKLNESKKDNGRCVSKADIKLICEKLDRIVKGSDQRGLPPWKIPDNELECLPFGDCIEKSMCHLDDFYKNRAWQRMPQVVKECLITVYCKMGWKEMRRFTKLKRMLEIGSWKEAATALKRTDWVTFWDPAGGNEIYFKLRAVKEQIKPTL